MHIAVQVAMSWVMSQSQASASFKVVLLGEGIDWSGHISFLSSLYLGCVGKSSIVLRYVDDKFNTGHLTTLQVCSPRYHVQASIGVRDMSCIWGHDKGRVIMSHCRPPSWWRSWWCPTPGWTSPSGTRRARRGFMRSVQSTTETLKVTLCRSRIWRRGFSIIKWFRSYSCVWHHRRGQLPKGESLGEGAQEDGGSWHLSHNSREQGRLGEVHWMQIYTLFL